MFDPTASTLDERSERPSVHNLAFGQATSEGLVRKNNEDHLASAPELGFFVVADGVGGGPAGSLASRLATSAMVHSVRTSLRSGDSTQEPCADNPLLPLMDAVETYGTRLQAAAWLAHKIIFEYGMKNGCYGAATTMASLWIAEGQAHIANTGDSRVYKLAGDQLVQLTQDHTIVQEIANCQVQLGTEWKQRLRNVVTQVLGGKKARMPTVHTQSESLETGQTFLLCTDGLTNMVPHEQIASVLLSAPSPQHAADRLVQLANNAGGLDNITCIVVSIQG
ncbi:MAG: serine/threonine-protein phosphatase [Polyangiaceae bacterium]|nr:serine/threonine-protein phosphatase [Polyangiaceae bacterium]